MQEQVVAGKASALVASDFGKALSVDGGDYADAPAAMEPAAERRTLSVQAKGEEKPIAVTAAAKARLLFVQDGFAAFGKVALGSAPGAIEVSVDLAGLPTSAGAAPVVSLDGGDAVELPHLFESVSSGGHTIRIPDVQAGDELYAGLEENVTVEPGKRLVFDRRLSVGHATIHVDGIPSGSTLLIDGEERSPVANPAGEMAFEGTVDAGTLKIEVSLSNKTWYNDDYLGINGTAIYSVKRMPLRYSLQKRSIRFRGKESDWDGIDPIFTHAREVLEPKISGSQITGGCICKDANNLYIKIDFSNGKPRWAPNIYNRRLILIQNGRAMEFQVSMWDNGTLHPGIWDRNYQRYQAILGMYSDGPSFSELQFPLSYISQYFDLSKPIRASLGFWIRTGTDNNETPPVNIIIGK
jgi:hypothetical protein